MPTCAARSASPNPPRGRRVGLLAGLALGALGCAPAPGATPPVTVASPGGVGSVAPLGARANPLEPDEPTIEAMARSLRDHCPGYFVAGSPLPCAGLVDHGAINAQLSSEDIVAKARTMVRMASDRDPETAAIGRFLLGKHVTPLTMPDAPLDRAPACADAPLARQFFALYEAMLAAPSSSDSDRDSLPALTWVAACGDLDALGLTGRVQALGRQQIERDRSHTGSVDAMGIWRTAYPRNLRSKALEALFFEGFEAVSPSQRAALLATLPWRRPLNEPGCARVLVHAMGDNDMDAGWALNAFLEPTAPCSDHLDRLRAEVEARLGRNAHATTGALQAVGHGCRNQIWTDRANLFERVKPLAGPSTPDLATRAAALEAACACAPDRARPLVEAARQGTHERLRAVAASRDCQR